MATKTPIDTPVRPDVGTQRPAPQLGLSMKNRLGFTMIALLGPYILSTFQWTRLLLAKPTLPAFYVATPSNSTTDCFNLDFSVPDHYGRAAGLDRAEQKVEFCEHAEILHGAPDLDGWALLNCDPGRGEWNTVMGPLKYPNPRGVLYMYPYRWAATSSSPASVPPTPLKLDGFPPSSDFHPLGATTFSDRLGRTTLYVVNHARERTLVEVFRLIKDNTGWRAEWTRSVAHPLGTHTANALVALSETQLLVTNDHLFARRAPPADDVLALATARFGESFAPYAAAVLGHPVAANIAPRVETLLGIPLSWVALVDFVPGTGDAAASPHAGVEAKAVLNGIPFANGLALSPDRHTLALAVNLAPGVRFYNVSYTPAGTLDVAAPSPLALAAFVNTPFLVDNLAFSVGGAPDAGGFGGAQLIAGGHPHALGILAMAADPRNPDKAAPSWVVAIGPRALDDKTPDPAPLSADSRMLKPAPGFGVKTLYQGTGAVPGGADGKPVGVSTSTSGAYDARTGVLLVPGLYAAPGVMVCRGVVA